jgi:gliding motility-associated-like protein
VVGLGDSTTIYPGESYQIIDQTNCTFFSWFPPQGLSNATISNPLASPEISTKYYVLASNEWGCAAYDSINIFVDPGALLALPNAFSPGGGANSTLKILKRGVATLNYFRIYDRWGVEVFQTTDIDNGWDGTYKGTAQPVGVYVYVFEALASDGTVFQKQGNVTLLR